MGSEKQKQKVKAQPNVGQTSRSARNLQVPPPPTPKPDLLVINLCAALILATLAAYANHFHNGFYFDDSHSIIDNPGIRTLRNIPRFFTDSSLFSSIKGLQVYRPLLPDPTNQAAMRYLALAGQLPAAFTPAPVPANLGPAANAESALNQSTEYCKKGMYPECLTAATQAMQMRPGWERAYNNMAAAFYYLGRWDEGIEASRQARPSNRITKQRERT